MSHLLREVEGESDDSRQLIRSFVISFPASRSCLYHFLELNELLSQPEKRVLVKSKDVIKLHTVKAVR